MPLAEFDLDSATWNIPRSKMKMKVNHLVPLSTQAVAILTELKNVTGRGRYPKSKKNGFRDNYGQLIPASSSICALLPDMRDDSALRL